MGAHAIDNDSQGSKYREIGKRDLSCMHGYLTGQCARCQLVKQWLMRSYSGHTLRASGILLLVNNNNSHFCVSCTQAYPIILRRDRYKLLPDTLKHNRHFSYMYICMKPRVAGRGPCCRFVSCLKKFRSISTHISFYSCFCSYLFLLLF